MILDDLLIYGDWLEENNISNIVYKQFLNLLRIKLRKNNQYGYGTNFGHNCGNGFGSNLISGNGYGFGFGYNFGYGNKGGNGCPYHKRTINENGNGRSI